MCMYTSGDNAYSMNVQVVHIQVISSEIEFLKYLGAKICKEIGAAVPELS